MPEDIANVAQQAGDCHTSSRADGLQVESLPSAHSTFYLSGQSVVFRVRDTLFKVDPALFTDGEDSVLKTMLSLPQADNPGTREGSSDETPIILHGVTPIQFETLLWGLYSQKLCQAHVSEDDVDRYIQLAKISHKYDFRGLEAWATSGLRRLMQTNPSVRRVQAVALLDTFCLSNCANAANFMLETVKEMLVTKTCSTADITAFINIGQRYNLPGLTTRGYYAMMLRSRSEWESEVTFSRTDRRRLLNGHYTLSDYSLDDSIESLRVQFAYYYPSLGAPFSAYASKEEIIRKSHDLKFVDVAERLRQLVEAFLRDSPAPSSRDHLPPGPSGISLKCLRPPPIVFRKCLGRHIDDLFKNKFPLYFVDV
ncbi:hypothetical protein JB92DRAFT_320031 [Gautieria morchelliformis]|nr:hypothetical protein JB92DRAFT_320031 [Gautieria morchelliformis]